jgi:aryl-alcohol dehydrogenase-like predicted oxidoreductase
MKIQRREFLGSALAGTAGALVAGELVQAAPAVVDPTAIVPLGKRLRFCRIGCGTGVAANNRQCNQTRMGSQKFQDLLRYAYDQNIRLFDSADLYGTHADIGRALKDKPRESFQLVSKIWVRPDGLAEKERPLADVLVKRFLREFQTDYLDLLQIHCMTEANWPEQQRRQMDVIERLKEQGLIRAHGASIHSLEALEAAANEPWVEVIHARVNPYQARTDGPMEEVVPILQKAHAAGKGVIGMKLAGEGTFDAEQRRRSVRYVVGLDCVDVMIAGFEKPEQIDEFKTNVRRQLVAQAG